jgi:formimidoylglutamate deiminase
VTPKAIGAIAKSGATVCACPTTERNLGDGVIPADGYFKANVPVSLGTDSQAQIDLFEDARELEYHLRLSNTERNVLAPEEQTDTSVLARRLFECATVAGASSIGIGTGKLVEGAAADFFTVDLDDPSIAGASNDDLLSCIVFSMARTAIRDVVVGGKQIVSDGRHALQEEIVSDFSRLQKKLW